jgi:hypothetical protein
MKLKMNIATTTLLVVVSVGCVMPPAFAAQSNKNKNGSVKGEMKQSGKEAKEAGKSLGTNVKHGRVVRGGKQFGKHTYRSSKHFGKGTKQVAKKTGHAVKKAVKP